MPAEHDVAWIQAVRNARDHREFVGPRAEHDVNAALQFSLLTLLGLREHHTLLDVGCGALRAGRMFLVYLLPERYFGIEPEQWLVERAIEQEIGPELIRRKTPAFRNVSDFSCRAFGRTFDFALAQGVFTHAPERQIERCMREVAGCLSPTSLFVATFMEGAENHQGDEWLYPSITCYTARRMTEVAERIGRRSWIAWPPPRGGAWMLFRLASSGAADLPIGPDSPLTVDGDTVRVETRLPAARSRPAARRIGKVPSRAWRALGASLRRRT